MALTRQLAEMLLAEHKHRPIRGDLLLLGRQMVFMTPDEAQAVIERMGVRVRSGVRIELDQTPHGKERGFISDRSFFALFADADVRASDVSAYEGADIIFDLSGEVPKDVIGAFDFIYNGSVLDNVFDPAACMKNISRMLRRDGVCFGYEGLAHFGLAYLRFSPDWFFDYYAVNDFADAQIYLCQFEHFHRSAWTTSQWNAFVPNGDDLRHTTLTPTPGEVLVIVIAQKANGSRADCVPLQNLYRPGHRPYQEAFRRFQASPRRGSVAQSLRVPVAKREGIWQRLSRRRKGNIASDHPVIGMLSEDKPSQVF